MSVPDLLPAAASAPAPWVGTNLPSAVYRWGLVGITLLGAALRFAHIARPFNRLMAWNEGHYAMIALNFDRYGLWSQHNELGVDRTFSPGVPWLIWGAFKLFGPTEWAARLPIALSGIAAVVLVAVFARRLTGSNHIALISAGFAATAPGLVYYSQNVQLDMPAICCALAGAVAMLRYRDTGRWGSLVAAGLWFALAVWFKFTIALLYPAFLALGWPAWRAGPAARHRGAIAAAALTALTFLPSLLWVASGWLTFQSSEGFTHRFFFRDWDLRGIAKALLEIPLAVEAHLFIPIFVLLLLGIPALVRWRSKLGVILLWCAPWVTLYLLAPWDSLVNRYYDLPATMLLVVPAALGLWNLRAWRVRSPMLTRALMTGFALIMALTVAYDLWDPMTDRIARATAAHAPPIDPVPFYSARIVANLPRGFTVVDTPQTMFYAGGDPAWITITGGNVRWKIDDEHFDYIVLNDYGHGQEPYYEIDEALRQRLAAHHYVQIGPAVWAHARTAVVDLSGRSFPNVPYWSPAPAWRLRGMAVWQ